MKKYLLIGSVIAATHLTPLAVAAEETTETSSAKQNAVMATSVIGGAALGGPVGAVLGMIGGAFMVKDVEKAEALDRVQEEMVTTQGALDRANEELHQVRGQLTIALQQQQRLEGMVMSSLEFHILFHTGKDELTDTAADRLKELAAFINANPELEVRVHGHADPRGTDEYNNVLSLHRALNVKQLLLDKGVASERIQHSAYGADRSQAPKGNLDAYAAERRVSIEVFHSPEEVVHID